MFSRVRLDKLAYRTLLAAGVLLTAWLHATTANHVLRASLWQPPSVWRPLTAVTEQPIPSEHLPAGSEPKGTPDLDPLAAPQCQNVSASIVSIANNPEDSLVSLQTAGQHGRLLRLGSRFNDGRLVHIGHNPLRASPAVWLETSTGLCQTLLFGKPGSAASPDSEPQSQPEPLSIRQLAANEFIVPRRVLEDKLQNLSLVRQKLRLVPEQREGSVVGIRVFGIHPESPLVELGLRNGDRLEHINGYALKSPRTALQAYAALRSKDQLELQISRAGAPLSLHYRIE